MSEQHKSVPEDSAEDVYLTGNSGYSRVDRKEFRRVQDQIKITERHLVQILQAAEDGAEWEHHLRFAIKALVRLLPRCGRPANPPSCGRIEEVGLYAVEHGLEAAIKHFPCLQPSTVKKYYRIYVRR